MTTRNTEPPVRATLTSTDIDSPVGTLRVVASEMGIRAILWPGDGPTRVLLGPVVHQPSDVGPLLSSAVEQISEYFRGDRTIFDLPLDPVGTAFQLQAWRTLATIPFGSTVSYAEQAERMGDRRKARAVGAANGRNPISIVVPCHRVIGSTGSLTGFAGGTDAKRWLLQHEARVAGVTLL
jgi:methylated-DNA-[protein]-cysteine S-methyltransferase